MIASFKLKINEVVGLETAKYVEVKDEGIE